MTAITQEREIMATEETTPPRMPPRWFVHGAWRVHRVLNELSGGRFLWTTSNKRGWGAMRLTTIGRKSGQERSVIVGYVEDGTNLILIAMNGWDEGHPSWWLNLLPTEKNRVGRKACLVACIHDIGPWSSRRRGHVGR